MAVHLDEVVVKISGEMHYLLRAVDHEGEMRESHITKRQDRKAALNFLRKSMKRFGHPQYALRRAVPGYSQSRRGPSFSRTTVPCHGVDRIGDFRARPCSVPKNNQFHGVIERQAGNLCGPR
jgi:hypothetical protein